MNQIEDSRSVSDLWAALLSGVDEAELELPVSAADINRQSAGRIGGMSTLETVMFRLTGSSTRDHHIAVRTASRTLLSLQESLSSIGASLAHRITRAGKLPSDILRATELHLTPRIAPGSVEFSMVRPDGETLFNEDDDRVFNDSMVALLTFFGRLSEDEIEDSVIVSQLREFGPRTAKHLYDLSQALLADNLGFDVDWRDGNGSRKFASISRRSAAYLKSLAESNTESVSDETLIGTLVTVSQIDKQAIQLDDGSKVSLEADPDLEGALAAWFGKRVRASVQVTLRVSLTTGHESRTYELLNIEAANDEHSGAF